MAGREAEGGGGDGGYSTPQREPERRDKTVVLDAGRRCGREGSELFTGHCPPLPGGFEKARMGRAPRGPSALLFYKWAQRG